MRVHCELSLVELNAQEPDDPLAVMTVESCDAEVELVVLTINGVSCAVFAEELYRAVRSICEEGRTLIVRRETVA